MSSINKYESLKIDGTWVDRLKYVLSLSDKSEIEKYLKQSSTLSYDDLQMLLFLSTSTKNDKNLLEIFKTDSLPVRQRALAGKGWLKLQKDEKVLSDFLVESINDKNVPRYLKHHLLKNVDQIKCLKKSSSSFFDLVCRLTESNSHDRYNIDAHLVPFCTKDQILNILSRWSLTSLEQIDTSSPFYSKLIRYQPLIIIHLIKGDLKKKKSNYQQFSNYFEEKKSLLELIAKKEAKQLLALTIEYLNQLEKSERVLPELIESKQKYFFEKDPDQMIELITIVASNQPGKIKYATSWGRESELDAFSFPRSFSVENSVRLFSALYDTCKWSSNHTIRLFQLMVQNRQSYSIKKERKWLFDKIIQEKFGQELFLKNLLKEGDENSLRLFEPYIELTTPLSLHLISQYERNGIVEAKKRLTLIRYQIMTQQIYDQFLSLFKQTGSDVNQRQQNYPLFFKCAISTNEKFAKNVIQWIEKRFINEQIIVIETFLSQLSSLDYQFHFTTLPNNFDSIQSIIDIAINHLQQSTNTLQIIINYGLFLLQRAENYQNKEQRENIQAFAANIIKQCYSKIDGLTISTSSISESYPKARNIIADILISDVFPKLVSKCMLDQLNSQLNSCMTEAWRLPQIDLFINSFFTESFPSSTKLQSSFQIDQHSSIISLFLKSKSTRFDRVNQLINKTDQIFIIHEDVQRIALRSQQHRQLIDNLIQDEKCFTLDKLTNEQSKIATNLKSNTKNVKLPGLSVDLLNNSSHLLTGKQQEHITRIILNDYLQDKEVANLDKLKSLRVLRRLTHTYNETLEWIEKKEDSPLATKDPSEKGGSRNRGASAQPLDDIIICLPATFDLTPQNLLKHFDLLKTKLNSSNAKFISDAMLSISRKISDQIFLKHYVEFILNEQFQKTGITANKEILRLLNQYVSDPDLIKMIIEPLWNSHPHQDIRACLILTLLHFVGKSTSSSDETTIWKILEEAADDDYLPVIQTLFSAARGESRWPLSKLKHSSKKMFETFVNRIQFKILDHPTSLQSRSEAWTYIEDEHCDINKLIEKAQQLCIQFDKNGNTLWELAFKKILSSYKQQKTSSLDIIIDTIKKMMSRREEVDSKANGLDNQHDLPVYHRIQRLLILLNSHIIQFDNEKKRPFRSLTQIILQFDKTLTPLMATLLTKIAENKEDLEDMLNIFQENLSENYFERILTELSTLITNSDSCPFIQLLNLDEKLHLAQSFIKEKNVGLLVFDLLKNHVFNQVNVDREQCQNLLRQIRKSQNLFLRQQAMEYVVPWKEDGGVINDHDEQMSASGNSDMS